jgi:hypothetical protein
VLHEPTEQVTQLRQRNPVDLVARGLPGEIRTIARQDHGNVVSYLQ